MDKQTRDELTGMAGRAEELADQTSMQLDRAWDMDDHLGEIIAGLQALRTELRTLHTDLMLLALDDEEDGDPEAVALPVAQNFGGGNVKAVHLLRNEATLIESALELHLNLPAALEYRYLPVADDDPSDGWRARMPTETSFEYGFGTPHQQVVLLPNRQGRAVEFRWVYVGRDETDAHAYISDTMLAPAVVADSPPVKFTPPTRFTEITLDTTARHAYSRAQCFSAKSDMIAVVDNAVRVIGPNGREIASRDGRSPRWMSYENDSLFYCCGKGEIRLWNVFTNDEDILWKMPEGEPFGPNAVVFGSYEGAVAANRFVVATQASARTLYSVDLHSGTTLGAMPVPVGYDWAGYSRSGRWIVVQEGNGLVRYDRDFGNRTPLDDRGAHGDFVLGADGHDYYVRVNEPCRAICIDRPAESFDLGFSVQGHVSGVCEKTPGLVLFTCCSSCYGAAQGEPQQYGEMALLDIGHMRAAWKNRIVLGLHGSTDVTTYRTQPQGSINFDATAVIYTSDKSGAPREHVIRTGA